MFRIVCLLLLFSVFLPSGSERGAEAAARHLNVGDGLSNNFIHGITQDSRGRVWIATEAGLDCYDGYRMVVYKSYNSSLKSNFISYMYRDAAARKIWLGVKGYGLYCIDESSGVIQDVTPQNITINNVSAIFPVGENIVQIVCSDKTVNFDKPSRRFSIGKGSAVSGRLPLTDRNRFRDRFGNLWTGTSGDGVYLNGNTPSTFKRIIDKTVWCVLADKGALWVGGTGFLFRVGSDGQVKTIAIPLKGGSGNILSISACGDGKLLLAVDVARLLAYDTLTGQTSELTYQGSQVRALTFYNDRNTGITWITANDGIYNYRRGRLSKETVLNRWLKNQQTNGLRVDRNGRIWIGTFEDGLFLFDRNHRLVRHYTQQNGFFTNSVMHLRFGSGDRLWLCTPDGVGLFHTQSPDSPMDFGFKEGLTDPFIRSIAETPEGNAWVTTNNGLSYLDMEHKSFINFNSFDGVPEQNFNGGLLLTPDGKLLITTMGGLYVADARKLLRPGRVSQVHFTGFAVRQLNADQKSMAQVLPQDDGSYRVAYNENDLTVSFSVADKMQCPRTDYSYRIKELSNRWTMTDGNSISLMGLPSGHYTIQVRARLHGQLWSQASAASLRLYIAPPWWLSLPARLAYVLLGLLMLAVILQRYKRRLVERNNMLLERRSVEAEKESNRERLQFFTNIAHELRTPLTLIFGPLEQLEKSRTLGMEERQSVALLRGSANRLMSLINQLMDFRKAETHNKKLKIRRGRLQDVVRNIGNNFAKANRNAAVAYKLDIDDSVPEIWFDEETITTILTNLLSNAAKNTAQGEITVTLKPIAKSGKDYTCVSVADTGRGIPAGDLPHVFDRYYQVESGRQASGTGIGLALVKSLCELHKINVSVDSRVGRGTTFTLLVDNDEKYPDAIISPDTIGGRKAAATDGPVVADEGKGHKPLVLVVEDNTDINNYIAQNLSQDYIVIQASNGEEGLKAAKANVPDLIVCDIMMPVMDGISMTKLVKSDMATSHIPVIMLTAKTTMDDRQEGYESGADSYLTKPFSISMLRSRIHNLLETRQTLARHIMSSLGENSFSNYKEETGDAAAAPRLSRIDAAFLQKLNGIIAAHIADTKLNLTGIASEMGVSQSTLYRKVKALTGVTTNEYIRKMRLEHARKLMAEDGRNVSQAAYESGFADLAYFRQSFRKEFGDTPNNYLRASDDG